MAELYGKTWTRRELMSYIGDPEQVCGITPSVLDNGKSEGVKACRINTGGGLDFTVLPGRGMDISSAFYRGVPLSFFSPTGVTSPAYYEEQGARWLRSFFGGLLTTCGLTYFGAPGVDQGVELGLHGRVSNAAAENLSIIQEWRGDEFYLSLSGTVREAAAMQENIAMTRTISTALGEKSFLLTDVVENRGFEPQPFMLLYHCNFGFPLLGPGAEMIAPIDQTTPLSDHAAADGGVEKCREFCEPRSDWQEKVFAHELKTDSKGNTFVALVNRETEAGFPLGLVMRFSKTILPVLTEWKMVKQGFYVVGLEPGTAPPKGRAALREEGKLPMIDGLETKKIEISYEILDTLEDIEKIRTEAGQ